MDNKIVSKYSTIERGIPFAKYLPNCDLSSDEKKIADSIVAYLKGRNSSQFDELEFLNEIKEITVTQNIMDIFPNKIVVEKIQEKLIESLKRLGAKDPEKLCGYIIDNTFGYGKLGPLLRDPELEEIMINSDDVVIFVFHREYGMAKTDIKYKKEDLQKLINKIAKTVDKEFNEQYPILDARLNDGSRANATYNSISPFGYTLTIRKFSQDPISIIKLIQNNTISSEVASFVWMCIEGLELAPQNVLIIGGAGSGKTTLLMALTSFIRYSNRIITIEDTPEINMRDRDNWVSLEARIKTPNAPEITMDDLLKNSLRMRPDRIIVGEVRGKETQTLFTAMDTGHRGILGTLHANNSKETITRLQNKPMEVPETNIALLDIIINISKQTNINGRVIRRVMELTELERMDNTILLSNVYERQNIDEDIRKTTVPVRTLEKLAKSIGVTKSEIMDEIQIRKQILDWLIENKIIDYFEVTKIIQKYYEDPEKILNEIRN